MNEILMQTLIEKSVGQQNEIKELKEIVLAIPDHKEDFARIDNRLGEVQQECREIPKKISIPEEYIQMLSYNLVKHTFQLQQPLKQEVKHHHHLDKGLITAGILLNIVVGLVIFLSNAYSRIDQNKTSDIKYRYLQLYGNPQAKEKIHFVDSLYELSPGKFEKMVKTGEEQREKKLKALDKILQEQEDLNQLKDENDKNP